MNLGLIKSLRQAELEWRELERKRQADHAASNAAERGCNRAIGDTDRPRNALWKRERVLRKRLARAMRTADRQSRTEKRKNQKWAAVSRSSWKTIWSAWLELKTFPILSKHTKRVLDDWKE